MKDSQTPAGPGVFSQYDCWLQKRIPERLDTRVAAVLGRYRVYASGRLAETAVRELSDLGRRVTGIQPEVVHGGDLAGSEVVLCDLSGDATLPSGWDAGETAAIAAEGYRVRWDESTASLFVVAADAAGLLYGAFRVIRLVGEGASLTGVDVFENPGSPLRMINHWDNMDGSIERGYAGRSVFFDDNRLIADLTRAADYARLLASVGINTISINNVNVRGESVRLITEDHLPDVARLADVFRGYGVRLMLCVNFTSPIQIGGLKTADPLDPDVIRFWARQTDLVYQHIPDLRGFLVKADSEFLPGPTADGRTHADGANTIARALAPHGAIVIWRCFVYNCMQDWRDTVTDRPKAAFENFVPLDGQFDANVLLQIKNGPVDFQIREPVSTLFGAMRQTREVMELQITQEYTGQQKHLCYLVPLWKEVIDFDPQNPDCPGTIEAMLGNGTIEGIAGVVNVGLDRNWTGHTLAQANLYGYARLCWDPSLTAADIAKEWIHLTLGEDPTVYATVYEMLMRSRVIYEKYNAPLGIGWMCNPSHHYGPNVDGYEYAYWGTYHRADNLAIGVDRTRAPGGTAYTAQYSAPVAALYDDLATCPEELLLFFHRVPYTHRLRSGTTLIQHIYDTHFEGVQEVEEMIRAWEALQGTLHPEAYEPVAERLQTQFQDACEWRDVVNTYFRRKTGIPDEKGRKIHV